LMRTADQGADTIVWLVASAIPARSSGKLWSDRRIRPTMYGPSSRELEHRRERFWHFCQRCTDDYV
jgi:dehydrogenase/reductase SDR family member 12